MRTLIVCILLSLSLISNAEPPRTTHLKPTLKRYIHHLCETFLVADDPNDLMQDLLMRSTYQLLNRYADILSTRHPENPTWAQLNHESREKLELRLIEILLGLDAATY